MFFFFEVLRSLISCSALQLYLFTCRPNNWKEFIDWSVKAKHKWSPSCPMYTDPLVRMHTEAALLRYVTSV